MVGENACWCKFQIPDSGFEILTSPKHQITKSSHQHIITSSHHHIIRSVAPMALLFVFDIPFYHNFAPMELVQWLEKMHVGVNSKSRIPDSKSSHHQNTKSPNPHISTSSHRHIITSSHPHINTSSHQHIITSAHHHILTSSHHPECRAYGAFVCV
jgi:hypothetical protein